MERVAEFRGSVTLSGAFSVGDLLKVGDEDETSRSSVVVGGSATGRTLLDVIRDEEAENGAALEAHSGNGIHWKTFKDLLRRAGSSWAAGACSSSAEAAPPSTSLQGGHQSHNGERSSRGGATEPPAPGTAAVDERVSLMALLEETEVHWSRGERTLPPATLAEALAVAEEEKEEEEEEEEARGHGTTLCMCCSVCMVRRRGAAFIPCGHTFCRLCSRKLWASRSNCPLCNGFILEILNIF
ncbi:uncharacterized protein LOC141837589 [Curcuma longa]|uniref:uncharacterized protein LOC141837589 n=1 Tax=Curcuma longa TaxID=136217 RepID=UPI003D9EF32A